MLTNILKALKDDPAMRQVFLQKLLDNKDSGDNSSSVELDTKPRICDLHDSQDPYDFLQKKNKDNAKEHGKVITFGKNKGHYLNKMFILQVKTKLSADTIHYSPPTFHYLFIVPTKHYQ